MFSLCFSTSLRIMSWWCLLAILLSSVVVATVVFPSLPEVRKKLRNVDRIQADVVGMVCPKLQPPSGTGEISGVVLLVAALCDEEGDDGLTLCE
jgi:hypothetical protein